ncbi:hypothetical protein G7046_g10143 [Stylonectria norvegica]|nr:hypothetical protein G7046_g10143 [Stylonectria norvegica]
MNHHSKSNFTFFQDKRTWVTGAGVGRVDTVLLDARKELGLLLCHLLLPLAVERVEDLAADAGTDQPTHGREGKRHDAQCHEGVKRDLGEERLGHARGEEDGAKAAAEDAGGDGEEKLDAAALHAQLEELVPVESRHRGLGVVGGIV